MNGKRKTFYNPFKREKRYVTLNFVTSHGTRNGYPKFDVLLNEEEKGYIERRRKEDAVLFDKSLKEGERKEKKDFKIVIETLRSLNKYPEKRNEILPD